jgi:hypothetical protein
VGKTDGKTYVIVTTHWEWFLHSTNQIMVMTGRWLMDAPADTIEIKISDVWIG